MPSSIGQTVIEPPDYIDPMVVNDEGTQQKREYERTRQEIFDKVRKNVRRTMEANSLDSLMADIELEKNTASKKSYDCKW